MNLKVYIETGENGWLVGQVAELPAVLAQGRDEAELLDEIQEALAFYLEVQRDLTLSDRNGQARTVSLHVA